MIELKDLTCRFGDTVAVDRVSLSIPKGQIFGYLGPNGAGKTTTVKMLTGMIPPSEGVAFISGYDIRTHSLNVKQIIGYVPESGALYSSLTPFEYLQFVGRLYGMEDKILIKRIHEFTTFFQIKDNLHQRMVTFSKGMKQKVIIVSALLHNPDVLFLDEPLHGLDANSALLLKEYLRNLSHEGRTIFYCSHILEVVENLCDRVVIINHGQIVADGSIDKLKKMTERSSLEDVFSQLTQHSDPVKLAKQFSKKMSNGDSKIEME